MNDEIKEILDWLKDENKDVRNIQVLTRSEINELLDYITNLQQENERLKEYYNLIVKVNEKNIDRYCDYYSRCEKAIEYMKKNEFININNYWEVVEFYQDLLNILQNGSDEE